MPDSIDLARYSVFVPPDPFEDHTGPFYFRIHGDARAGGQRALRAADRMPRHGNYAGGVHGGAILAFADYALCLVAGRAADGGTNTSFAMTVSIAVEFLDAGRIGAAARGDAASRCRSPAASPSRAAASPSRARRSRCGRACAATWRVPRRWPARTTPRRRAASRRRRPCRAGFELLANASVYSRHIGPSYARKEVGRRDDDPADPAPHVQLGRRAAWRLHDELRQFGGDARRRRW